MAAKIKEAAGAMERILLPRLNSIDGELKSINTRIDEVDKRMSIRFDGTNTKIEEMDKRMNTKMDEMDKRMTAEIRGLSEKIDLIKDVEKLKVDVAELQRRR
jgi:hypothetical protein